MRLRDVARLVLMATLVVVWMMPVASAFELNGAWNFSFDTDDGTREAPMTLQLDGDQVAGRFVDSEVKGTFRDGKLDLKFPHYSPEGGLQADLVIKGTADGDTLKGNWSFGEHHGTFTAAHAK